MRKSKTMLRQRSLKSTVKAVGLGLHSGERIEMTLRPAPANTGIIFRRVDVSPAVDIAVNALAVSDTRMASTLSVGNVRVQTVEHLMSACAGLGIDNLLVEMNAEEVPILDGSATAFVYLLQSAGIEVQEAAKQFIRVTKTVEVRDDKPQDNKWARLSPHFGFKMQFEIDFGHPALDSTGQCAVFDVATNQYARDIARARTFGFTRDVEMLRARGLALGGGFDNAIVIDDYRILNSDGLRYEDEFARHKILDAMGDLYLIGKPLIASYEAYRSGHGLNNLLLRELIEQNAFEIVTFENAQDAPAGFDQPITAW